MRIVVIALTVLASVPWAHATGVDGAGRIVIVPLVVSLADRQSEITITNAGPGGLLIHSLYVGAEGTPLAASMGGVIRPRCAPDEARRRPEAPAPGRRDAHEPLGGSDVSLTRHPHRRVRDRADVARPDRVPARADAQSHGCRAPAQRVSCPYPVSGARR